MGMLSFFFFQAEDGIRDLTVTGVQTCALPISVTVHVVPGDPRPELAQRLRQQRLAGPVVEGSLNVAGAELRRHVGGPGGWGSGRGAPGSGAGGRGPGARGRGRRVRAFVSPPLAGPPRHPRAAPPPGWLR